MKSLQLGSIAGIRIQVHWTFVFVVVWVLLSSLAAGSTLGGAVGSLAFILTLFGCVLLHELGHALAAQRYGIPTRDITLLPIGGVARLERMPRKPSQELVVALAGPAVNVVIAAFLFVFLTASGTLQTLEATASGDGSFLNRLMIVNVALVLFNLLPAFPLDGGRVLRALLGIYTSYARATRIAAVVGQVFALGFLLLGLSNPILLLIAVFVFFGAAAEARQVAFQERLSNVTVGEGMLRRFRAVPPQATLAQLAENLMDGPQKDFPVVDEGLLVGMLNRDVMLGRLGQPGVTAADVMSTSIAAVDVSDNLIPILQGNASANQAIPVTQDGVLIGLLETSQVLDLVEARAAARRATRPSVGPAPAIFTEPAG